MKRYIVLYAASKWYSLNIDDYEEFGEWVSSGKDSIIITTQSSDVVRHLKSKKWILPNIVDLECFDKQMSQEGKEVRNKSKWTALGFLQYYKVIDSDFKLTEDKFKLFLEYLGSLYLELLEKDDDEKSRFEEIEVDINKIVYNIQWSGINIDFERARRRCEMLEKEIYSAKNRLQFEFDIYQPDNETEQINYLKSKKANIITSPFYTFKTRRREDEISNIFYELIRNRQDLESLLYILARWGGEKICYPRYLGFGTITSRIVLRQPSLQNLRKSNRDVLVPESGCEFLYIDYSQFEAGILASLSKDSKLISLYDSDIYADLADKLLGDSEQRAEAKIIFYRYMYGDESLNKSSKEYFNSFKGLKNYISSIEIEMKDKGKVGTTNGNFRKSLSGEGSWALSHVVQSTASLIYKSAVIRVNKELPKAKFLIPMHDATLYQLPSHLYEVLKEKIEIIYKEEFKRYCPEIAPKTNSSTSFS